MTRSEPAIPPEVSGAAGSAVLLVLRLGLGTVFLVAAYLKLFTQFGPMSFAEAIQAFKVVQNDTLVTYATFMIPWTELVAGLALVLGVWTRAAGLILALLLAFFIALIVSSIERGLGNIKCGCLGNYRIFCEGTVNWCKVGENAVLMTGALVLQTFGGGRFALGRLLGRLGA